MKTYGNNTLELLNTSIDKFYTYSAATADENKVIEFKALFVTLLNQLERVFNGTFGKAFRMDDKEDYALFKKLYPVVYKAATIELGNSGVDKLCSILAKFRNISAHAFNRCNYKNDLDAKYILEQLPNYSDKVIYYDNRGIPTIGGMITLLFFLSNDKGIEYFIKNDIWYGFLEHLNYFGPEYIPNKETFPEQCMKVSKINDEIDIRKPGKTSKDLITALFGRFADTLSKNGNTYIYHNGEDEEGASWEVTLEITEKSEDMCILMVQKGSRYLHYFSEDYQLIIHDIKQFKEWCESVPPFMFVVYLYMSGINTFDKKTISEEKAGLVLKLNKPKFYVDKNISILLLGSSISDLRGGSQTIAAAVNYCLYLFEYRVYKKQNIRYDNYSSLRIALAEAGAKNDVIEKMTAIRNFFSHYHILGDEHLAGKSPAKFNMNFIIMSFDQFARNFENIDRFKSEQIIKDFFYRVLCLAMTYKYLDICGRCSYYLNNPSSELLTKLNKSIQRVESSFVTRDIEYQISTIRQNNELDVEKVKAFHVTKHIIHSKNTICLLNKKKTKGPLTLYLLDNVAIGQFIRNKSMSLIRSVKEGLITVQTWIVS